MRQVIVLGAGLAGSFLACRLLRQGCHVTLIDDRAPMSASRVAAGLYNVITGRFGSKTWKAETLLAELDAVLKDPFFQGVSQFIHPIHIYRPFKDVEEYNQWSGWSAEPAYHQLVKFEERPLFPEVIHNPLGGIRILPCGWVNIGGLIDRLQDIFRSNGGVVLQGSIPYDQINMGQKTLTWKGEPLGFDQMICCEGYRIRQNPWFEKLPVQPNKGEILEIESEGLDQLPFVITKKVYMVPGESGRWIVGSTYEHLFDDPGPTEAGRAQIEEQLRLVLKVPYKVVGHRAGIRPTTPNRRPILGSHPQWPFLYTLSGFGTKGMLAAPYCSRLMTAHILEGAEVPEELRITQFKAFRPT
ncbi:MAG: FAD-binding oxidoreductase [Bacteroidia bacterium]|nr:FAD-binding oxidoreductase [Bacteroidia bacterium]